LRRLLWTTWCQFQDFASLYSERLDLKNRENVRLCAAWTEHIQSILDAKRGAVVIMSHFGRWETATLFLARNMGAPTIVMGGKKAEGANEEIPDGLRRAGLSVIRIDASEANGFEIVELMNRVRAGELVAMSGDRAFGQARRLRMPFVGGEVDIPAAPYVIAQLTQAPVLIVFSWRSR
jgi:lauroyl/myristoyl acyltransferase